MKEEKKFTVVLLVTCALSCIIIAYIFVTSVKEAVVVEEVASGTSCPSQVRIAALRYPLHP